MTTRKATFSNDVLGPCIDSPADEIVDDAWDEEDHPNLTDRNVAPVAHGVVLWFQLDDFDAAVARARALKAEVIEEPYINPAPQHREMWLRDTDGYVVVICSPDGEAAG